MKNIISKKKFSFIIPIMILLIISLLDMYSASYISSLYRNAFSRQLLWVILGWGIFIIFYKLDKRIIIKHIDILYWIGVISLVMVLIFASPINGASSWFKIGPISIQPSELFKPFFIIYIANMISEHKGKSIVLLFKIVIFTIIPSILIFLEPDTGVVIMYILIMIGALFASPVKKWPIFIFIFLITVVLLGFFSIYFFNKDLFIEIFGTSFFYRIDRILDFKNNSSYQLNNALIGIGSASGFGYGITHPKIYIPEAITDFVFDLTILNFGYTMGIIVISIYTFILYKIFKLYKNTSNTMNKSILSSIFYLMLFQIFEHIFMNLGITPITGITLPFLSYGGSSLISYFFIFGLILKVD